MTDRILVVGGGGREHAIVWKIKEQHPHAKVYCAPGNAGIARLAELVNIGAEDIPKLYDWVKANKPDLTVVGPEAPLCAGLADKLTADGYLVFGPNQEAARIEGSKSFAKDVMNAAGVPTAKSSEFTDAESAIEYVESLDGPFVVKYDGLAAGKGVTVCQNQSQGTAAILEALTDKKFGDAGRVIVEEFLDGEEASVIATVNGLNVNMFVASQDHKPAFETPEDRERWLATGGDQRYRNDSIGPNTGGMGAYSHAPVVTPELMWEIKEGIFLKTLEQLQKVGIDYRGALYAGLMIKDGKAKVLEFNCRFGDPETQVILPPVQTDFLQMLVQCAEGTLKSDTIVNSSDRYVCVAMVSGGYPGSYAKGKAIHGLYDAEGLDGITVFHAGTKLKESEHPAIAADVVLTSGGRVLGVTARGKTIDDAIAWAYNNVQKIRWENEYHRTDIGNRARGR
jgi:phosphoribosylamine--glycine ligase